MRPRWSTRWSTGCRCSTRCTRNTRKGTAPGAAASGSPTLYRAVDGFVIVSGEYNHGIPPALKNLLDHFLEEYFFRPSAIVCYSAGSFGGVRAAMQLRMTLAELGMPSIPSLFPVPKVQDAFDDDGQATRSRHRAPRAAVPRRARMVRAGAAGGAGQGHALLSGLAAEQVERGQQAQARQQDARGLQRVRAPGPASASPAASPGPGRRTGTVRPGWRPDGRPPGCRRARPGSRRGRPGRPPAPPRRGPAGRAGRSARNRPARRPPSTAPTRPRSPAAHGPPSGAAGR